MRFIILVISGLTGGLCAAAYMVYYGMPSLPPANTMSKSNREWFQMMMVLDTCAIFFAISCLLCEFGARLFLSSKDTAEARTTGRIMSARMCLVSGFYIVCRAFLISQSKAFMFGHWFYLILGVALLISSVASILKLSRTTGRHPLQILLSTF